jgi:hypothetical protein
MMHSLHIRSGKGSQERKSQAGIARADVVAILGCTTIALAVALPVLARAGTDSGETRSLSNLRILAAAHEAYSQTFSGKQFGVMPEDAGAVGGNCSSYVNSIACPPPLLLGLGPNGAWWGYYLGSFGLCAQYSYPGSCGNWVAYKPIEFSGADAGFGSFRLGNATAFNAFVDGRFYSDTFYSPNDRFTYELSARYRDPVYDFNSLNGEIGLSSYCLSSAAMYNPAVFASENGGFKNPNTFAEGYVSPTVSQCAHPDLKTRIIEHNWNVGAPSFSANPNQSFEADWLFNYSSLAAPNGFFFDGHVTRIRNAQAIADDEAVFQANGTRLWSRTTPFGELGYGQWQPSPEATRTSHTILTIDGILGRDVLTPQ